MEDELLCFGMFCENKDIPIEKRRAYKVKERSFANERINEYINLAFDYAEKTIVIYLCMKITQE